MKEDITMLQKEVYKLSKAKSKEYEIKLKEYNSKHQNYQTELSKKRWLLDGSLKELIGEEEFERGLKGNIQLEQAWKIGLGAQEESKSALDRVG